MVQYRTVANLDPRDAAYIAGIIDGEGTITLTAIHRNEKRRLVISISNTEFARESEEGQSNTASATPPCPPVCLDE